MKKLIAFSLLSTSLLAKELPIHFQEGDFIKGELHYQASAPLQLVIQFPDQSQRRLVKDIFGTKEFMFTANQTGEGKFLLQGEQAEEARLHIIQHLPKAQQKAGPTTFDEPQLQQLAEKIRQTPSQQNALLDDFWQAIADVGTPLVQAINEKESRVTFLWRGAKENVRIWGGITTDHDFMHRFLDTDLWYRTYIVPNDTRVEYRFAPDIPTLPVEASEQRRALLATVQADPLNRSPWFDHPEDNLQNTDKFNYYSTLVLPKAKPQKYLQAMGNPKGELKRLIFQSDVLGNQRQLKIYLPAGFQHDKAYPVLYLFDGVDYSQKVPTPTILDNLIAEKAIPPTIAVFIDNPSQQARRTELPANPTFAKILATELVPFVEETLQIKAKERIISGSSYGGLASAYLNLTYPEIFSKALIMSGSFWWHPKDSPSEQANFIAHQFAKAPIRYRCFFISAGYYESGKSNILETSRHLADVLIARGYPVHYQEDSTAHGYLAWQGVISQGLISLLNPKHCP